MRPISVQEVAAFRSQGLECINDILYDTATAINTSALQSTLFQAPIGSSGNNITGKTEVHTNMTNPGVLPNNEQFRILGYTAWLWPSMYTALADVATSTTALALFTNGYFQITLGNKTYRRFPIGALANIRGNISDTTATTAIYMLPSPFTPGRGFLGLASPIHVYPKDQIKVDVYWNAANSANNVWYLSFGFFGYRFRAIQ